MSGGGIERRRIVAQATTALSVARSAWRHAQSHRPAPASFPDRERLRQAVAALASALFPGRLSGFRGDAAQEDAFVADSLSRAFDLIAEQAGAEHAYWLHATGQARGGPSPDDVLRLFAGSLSRIRSLVDTDVAAIFAGDPAARSVDEVLICYPGAVAILHHRIAHELDALGLPVVARIISEIANERTGIDIHPGATIGPSFFIDHGTGIVIGETAVIGARVRLYQHVTLGALHAGQDTPRDGTLRTPRHPVVGDDVLIYSGATILGRVRIGDRSVIGGNAWLLDDVPPDSEVLQPPVTIACRPRGKVRLSARR